MPRKKHHYIAKCYLEGFRSGRRNSLWVCERNGRTYCANPTKIAAEHDLYLIPLQRQNPEAVEKIFSHIESNTADFLKSTLGQIQMPDSETRSWLALFKVVGVVKTKNRHV